jgi:dienelactone hydrolase
MIEIRVPYEYEGRKFEGMVVADDSVAGMRPVLLMQPDWKGVGPETLKQAREIAARDFVVLMADLYGADYDGESRSREELMASVKALRGNPSFISGCSDKAYAALSAVASNTGLADVSRRVMAGYCAGGGYALEHARAGADFRAVVVFHVTNPNPFVADAPCNIKGRVLALHGSADPVTPKPMMDELQDELTRAGVDWQVMMFGGARHSFCDPDVATTPAAKYDAALCRKSYMLMRDFLAETFAGHPA